MMGLGFGGFLPSGGGNDHSCGKPLSKIEEFFLKVFLWLLILFIPCMVIYQCMEAADIKDSPKQETHN